MPLKNLELRNFRSYEKGQFSFAPAVNLIVGRNGSGKTNLLEAVYLLSSGRSFRGPDRDMVAHGDNWYLAEGNADQGNLKVTYKDGIKRLLINNKKGRPEKFVGRLPVVLFEPNSVNIVAGPPEERRRFLNRLLSTLSPRYLRALIDYKRVLKQRNALLRRKVGVREQVFAWDIKLVTLAAQLFEQRLELLEQLQANISHSYQTISKQTIDIRLSYSASPLPSYAEDLLSALQQHLERDILLGYTTVGPHRDDVLIEFNNELVTRVASRGEQRTLTLALKLLELEQLETALKQPLLILLDDVFSELDGRRRGYLLERLEGHQTIITATDTAGLRNSLPKQHAKIELGKANARRRQDLSTKARQTTRSRARRSAEPNPKHPRTKIPKASSRPQPKRRRA